MRFCAVLGHYPKETPGGAEFQAYLIMRELASRGHETHYVTYRSSSNEVITDENITVHKLDIDYNPPEVPQQLIRKIESIDPMYVYFRNFKDLYILREVKERIAGETIFNLSHNRQCMSRLRNWRSLLTVENVYKNLRNPRLIFRRRLFSEPDYCFAQTRYQQRLLKENHGVSSYYVGNGHPIPDDSGQKHEPPVVLWLASLKPWKRPEKFLALAERCQDIDCQFWLVGRSVDDDFTETVLERAEQLPNVSYKGGCDIEQSNQYIAQASLFVNTSKQEGFPNTFIQSWLRRTPVVSLSVDPDEHLRSKEIGEFANGDIDELVRAVRALVQNDEKRATYGANAREYACENHSISAVVDRIEDVLE